MFTIYILYSMKDRRLYVGCTSDVNKRLKRHNYGEVSATKSRRPLVLIHQESFNNKGEAFQKERFLKSLWGAREKKKILREWLDKNKI